MYKASYIPPAAIPSIMAINVLRAVTSLLSRAKHKLRRQRLLFSRRAIVIPFFGSGRKQMRIGGKGIIKRGEDISTSGSSSSEDEYEEEVWRRGIIMGEKCEPLDFSGVIYYDCDGRQLAEVPMPKSPMRSPLPVFLAEGKAWN